MNSLWTGLLTGLGGAVLALLATYATAWPKLPQQTQEVTLGQLVAFTPKSIQVAPQPLPRALEAASELPPILNGTARDERVVH